MAPRASRGGGPKVRLQRFLALSGIAARRKAEVLIVEGRVHVNGKLETRLGTKVHPKKDEVTVDGKRVLVEDLLYVLLNKPKACVTTMSDPQGRKTVIDLLPTLPAKVKPVGRLDYYTEGVLLLTNDGELAANLLSPKRHVEKIYHAKFRGKVTQGSVEKMVMGVIINRRKTKPALVDIIKFTGRHTWLVITLTEGRSRQIHRMAQACGHQVNKLSRVSFGGITYEGLRLGESRKLTKREINHLRVLAGMPKI